MLGQKEGSVISCHQSSRSYNGKTGYTYSASEFAANAQTFRELIVDEHLVRLDDLTSKEQTILDEAIDGEYKKQTQSRFPLFHRLRDRLPNQTVPESGGKWFIEYKGKRYGLDLSFVYQGVDGIWCMMNH